MTMLYENLSKCHNDEPIMLDQPIYLDETGLITNNPDQKKRYAEVRLRNNEAAMLWLYCESEEFSDMVDSGHYRYIEDMIIINHPRYVTLKGGDFRLTAYARSHLNECALLLPALGEYVENPCSTTKGVKLRKNKKKAKKQRITVNKDEKRQLYKRAAELYTASEKTANTDIDMYHALFKAFLEFGYDKAEELTKDEDIITGLKAELEIGTWPGNTEGGCF